MFNNQNEKIQDYLSHNEKSLERFIFFLQTIRKGRNKQ
jgi:hypothetical protein